MTIGVLRNTVMLLLTTLLVVLGATESSAQRSRRGSAADLAKAMAQINGQNPFATDTSSTDTTTRKPRIRKPLESYLFDDSLRRHISFAWKLDMESNDVKVENVDTSLNRFHIVYPFIRNTDVGSAYQGQLGGASVPLNYFARPNYRNFEFAQAFDAYRMTPSRVRYYNTKKPFTHFSYYQAGQTRKEESSFNAIHEQNISPSSGFGIDYTSLGTKGTYSGQKTRDKSLALSFAHTGKKYTLHAGYIYNSAELRENGGISRDEDVTDTVFELPENVPINLEDAKNRIKNNTYYLIHSYGMPLRRLTEEDFSIADRSTIFFGHAFEYSRNSKRYTDTKKESGDYYEHWYINPQSTNDSIFETLHSERLFVQIQPWDRNGLVSFISAGVGYDWHYYYMFGMNRYLGNDEGQKESGGYIYGSVQGKLKRYLDWKAGGRLDAVGYRNGDRQINAELSARAYIKDLPISLVLKFENEIRTPGYWMQNYFSNHFVWQNSFAKENETRFDVTLKVPQIHFELGGYHSIAKDKIYYGPNVVPLQASGSVDVSGLYASKEFRLGGLNLNHRVLLQRSSNQEVIPVPNLAAYFSYNYEFTAVKDVLRMQIGVDGKYHTKYYAFGYNPAIAQFYNQREKELGNYLNMDLYVSCKWKRMRILVKLQHFNEDMIGEREYFTALHYPENVRMLKLGLSWTFYD